MGDEESIMVLFSHHSQLLAVLTIACAATSCSQGILIARNQPIDPSVRVASSSFESTCSAIVKMPWTSGNHVQTLLNGKEIFPAMLQDIKGARKSITFETYIFSNGKIAREFTEALCERAGSGVKVHIVLDAMGAMNMSSADRKSMAAAGIDLKFYNPLQLFNLRKYNTRDHRKIMVIDGKIGYSGGCGIDDAWMGDAHTPEHWRENHYRLTGPVVAQLQQGFNDNWVKCGGKLLTGSEYFPVLEKAGDMKAQAYNASPQANLYTIPHIFRQAMASARKSIVIKNSYFYLDRPMLKAIREARKRGVHVELILAWEHTDAWPVRHLSIYQYHRLLKAGVHIYEYRPSMIHCKVMVVDGLFSIIGSSNMDPRSLYINDEANVNILSKSFADEQLRIIENDKKRSKRVTKAPFPWNPVTIPSRAAVTLIAPQL